ncbi:hypothetical protein MNBD_GAMMA19-1175 [hydrothermal vent metagenome]|uniref:Lipoprotein n=1 Tax=hydrothermal vent metagenome TaxID=652676 RepID=A0A3B1ASH3_9ZZZZ
MQRLFILAVFLGLSGTACSDNLHNDTAQPEAIDIKQNIYNTKGLDLLTNYDKDLWDGPAGWSDKQWKWKKRLRWDKECDYIGEVEVHPVSKTRQLIQIMCVPGAYQAMYYLFLYDSKSKSAKQLALGAPKNTDNPNEISGHLKFSEKNSLLSIVTLSRGIGDCGIYRVFSFKEPDFLPKLIEERKKECGEDPLPENPPKSFFNPEKWPLVNVDKNRSRLKINFISNSIGSFILKNRSVTISDFG